MHIKSLKVFCDVVERRSFSRAADENGISQSGVSQMVHHLEDHLGVKLIDRSKRPFVLTSEGEVYYEGCRKLVQQMGILEEEVRSLHHEMEGRVVVGSIYSVGLSHMQRFVTQFSARYPKAQVQLEYHHPQRIYEMVESNQLDVGLVSYPRSSKTIECLPWRDEPMCIVCAVDHDLATASSVRLAELEGRNMVAFSPDLIIRERIDQELQQREVKVEVVMEFDNIDTLKSSLEINAGFSILPCSTVTREVEAGSLVCVPVSDLAMSRPVGIIHLRGGQLGVTARRFIQLLRREEETSPAQSQAFVDATSAQDVDDEWPRSKDSKRESWAAAGAPSLRPNDA